MIISPELQKWQSFGKKYNLTEEQLKLFSKYAALLQEWNQKINLTRIIKTEDIIDYHFDDSLSVTNFVDFNNLKTVCDVGTGAGFPGIPIKIMYPNLKVILIEVVQKKIIFLNDVIKEFKLDNIEVCSLDWRTFLRKTSYKIDLFCARASLHTDELLRIFSSDSMYKIDSNLIYWASYNWEPNTDDLIYLKKEGTYEVGDKKRKLIFFGK